MDEILADYNEAELELLAGFLQKVTAAGVIAAALSDRGDALASGTASARQGDLFDAPPTHYFVRRFGAKPDKKLVDDQAARPSSWKTPRMAAWI
jgi:hypothetical protein